MDSLPQEKIAELYEKAAGGDGDAEGQLLEDCGQQLKRMISRKVPRSHVPDVVHDALTKFIQHVRERKNRYDPSRAPFRTFLREFFARPAVREWHRTTGPDSSDDGPERPVIETENKDEEERQLRYSEQKEAFRLLFLYGGLPHQVLAFGFARLIHGGRSPGGSGKPQRVAAELGEIPLGDLAFDFWNAFCRDSQLPEAELRELWEYLQPLRDRLQLKVSSVATRIPPSLDGSETVADTTLRDWVGNAGNFAAAISHWCYVVLGNMKRALQGT